ncbi:MAG TPA: HD domain-containing phosphohydrolase [Thermoanaerobaculia bacterium]|nr:HD domain-containing phosphohydrolase [Thermoanaerobaculia bacterium]
MPALKAPRTRLVWTLVAILAVVGIIPLIVSHYFLIGINRESLETLEKQYLTRSAVGVATQIEASVDSYRQQLGKIAGGIAISARGAGGDAFRLAEESGVVATYVASDPELVGLRIVDANGSGATAQPARLDAEVEADLDRGLKAALGGSEFIGTFQHLTSINQPVIVVAVPIVQSGGAVIGAVEALVSLRKISDRLREESRGDVTAFVIDGTGRVLMHSEPAVSLERPDYSALPIVAEFMKARQVRLIQTYEDPHAPTPTEVLGTVASVGTPDWGVVVQKEVSKAFASVDRMTRSTIQWVGIALALTILVAFLFAAGIARPIRTLAARTREIAAGNYQQRVEISSRNEIGELADNFNLMSAEIEKAVAKLRKAAEENHQLFINSIRMLAAAIDAKDPYTRGHSDRVARYAIGIGRHLGMTDDELRKLRISALLHDVGKIGIDDRILRKPGALSDEEFAIMKTHPEKGAVIMSGVPQLIDMIPGMKYHHERWDGGGYPDGLKHEQVPLQARIVAIADTFDAMTTNRPYQKAMQIDYVVQKINSLAESRFDPRVVAAFEKAVRAGDIQVEEQIRGAA